MIQPSSSIRNPYYTQTAPAASYAGRAPDSVVLSGSAGEGRSMSKALKMAALAALALPVSGVAQQVAQPPALVQTSATHQMALTVADQDAPPAPSPSPSPVDADQTAAQLASDFGVDQSVIDKVQQAEKDSPVLATLPPSIRSAWHAVSPDDRIDLDKGFQGTSGFLFIRVSNKKAFISGEVAGHNVFDDARKDLDKELKHNKISQETHDRFVDVFEAARPLTKDQRASFMRVMDADAAFLKQQKAATPTPSPSPSPTPSPEPSSNPDQP